MITGATEMYTPKGFCKSLPLQPRVWDPSFLAVAATCWRKHWLQTVRGLRRNGSPSIHLTWGKAYHAAVEEYDHMILDGWKPQDAKAGALSVAYGLANYETWGETIETWQCTDPEMVPAKRLKVWRHRETGEIYDAPPNVAGAIDRNQWELVPKMVVNRDRCRFAKGPYTLIADFGIPVPGRGCRCPGCDGAVELGSTFVPYDPKKTGETLIAAVEAYCDSVTSIKPYQFPDGTKGLELQARLPLEITSPDREIDDTNIENPWTVSKPYELLVNLDSLVEWEEEIAIRERKTTGRPFDWRYWAQFDLNVQIDTYDLVGSVLYPDAAGRPPKIMVEATRVGKDDVEIERQVIRITEGRRAEWFAELQDLILEAECKAENVAAGVDPEAVFTRNTTACIKGFQVCPFYQVCQAAPSEREAIIEADYHVERWCPEDATSVVEESE